MIVGLPEAERRRIQRELLATALPAHFGPLDDATIDELEQRVSWIALRRGEAPFRQGDPADGWYVVASGRLQVVAADAAGREKVLGEVGRGESLGEATLLAGGTRAATPYALRDTDLLWFSRAHFEEFAERHPRMLLSIARTLVRRSLGVREATRPEAGLNIAIVPARPGVAIEAFTRRLLGALRRIGRTLHLSPARAADLGALAEAWGKPEDDPSWRRLSAWLDERVEDHRFVVLEGEAEATAWTRRALREADHVLLVADARHPPEPHPLERDLFGAGPSRRHAQRTLVLLHPPGTTVPRGTARWLDARDLQHHQHVGEDRPGDLDRVARALGGVSVNLVLGAGGARGMAHIGVLRAMAEAHVPVDHIGGASIGALVGALHGMGRSPDEMMDFARRAVATRPFSLTELSLPIASLVRGRRVEQLARLALGDTRVEDLWIPFFCNACDLSRFQDLVFDRGPLVDIILAATALPGVLPPRLRDGRLLVDGGTTDMLPGELMRARSRGPLIAVDVSAERVIDRPIEHAPGSWGDLWQRVRPGGPRLPTASEVFWRAVSFGVAQRTAAVARDADLFLQPPVERYGTVAFGALREITEAGYAHARERLADWSPDPAPPPSIRPVP